MKCHFLLLCTILSVLACKPEMAETPPVEMLYIGTFSVRGSEGVYVYQFDRSAGSFKEVQKVSGPDSPSFLTISSDGRYLYTANRQGVGADETFGSALAYRIDSLAGTLSLINQSSSYGESPCHIEVDENGRWLYLSHYAGGSLCVLSLLPDGSIGPLFDSVYHSGQGPNAERQEKPHVHSIRTISGSPYFLAADLGTDKVYIYEQDQDSVRAAPPGAITTEPGSGPRHFTFLEGTSYVYVAEELSSSVSVYSLNLDKDNTQFIHRLSTLPEGFSEPNSVADIHISPDGRFLYVSNRGHDSLAIFQIDGNTGRLSLVDHQKTGGKTPRNFMIDPQGAFLLAANQDTDEVIFFKRDPASGLLESTDIRLELPSPVCLKWLAL